MISADVSTKGIYSRPYWATNKEWYKINLDLKTLDCKITLTDKAPEEARKSFYEDMKENNNGKRTKQTTKRNSKEYRNHLIKLCGSLENASNDLEIFAYSLESSAGGVRDKLGDEVYRITKGNLI